MSKVFLQQTYKCIRPNQGWLVPVNKVLEAVVIFFGVCMILLGVVFVIAGSAENVLIGGILVLIAIVIFYFVYRISKIEARKPTLVSQTFNVKMEGSGAMTEKDMKCRSCGAPIQNKDISVIQGGIMAKCSYCGAMFALEEAPKW